VPGVPDNKASSSPRRQSSSVPAAGGPRSRSPGCSSGFAADRGCRTKITVKVDGSIERLWKNWSHGLHRVTCYGNLAKDLQRFCRFAKIKLVDEAA
jgi:hypothetical protein